jgi:beta-1,4-N-acetylglucosaminyltransferase
MNSKTVLLIYGEGGHRAEMEKLFSKLSSNISARVNYFGLFENGDKILGIDSNIELPVIRDKYSRLKTLLNAVWAPVAIVYKVFKLDRRHPVSTIISVGPGISILPCLYFKILRRNVIIVSIENSCKFKRSYTGTVMNYVADYHYVQNRSLLEFYSNAVYSGKLL